MTPNSNSAEILIHCTYPQVSSSYVYSFGSYRVGKLTNKQTPLKTSNALRYATTLGKNKKPPSGGLKSNVRTPSIAHWKAHGRLPIRYN